RIAWARGRVTSFPPAWWRASSPRSSRRPASRACCASTRRCRRRRNSTPSSDGWRRRAHHLSTSTDFGELMLIGIPLQTADGETRVGVTPETARKLKAQGHTLRVQAGAGLRASAPDDAYLAAGAEIADATRALGCDLVLTVRPPSAAELGMMKPGT